MDLGKDGLVRRRLKDKGVVSEAKTGAGLRREPAGHSGPNLRHSRREVSQGPLVLLVFSTPSKTGTALSPDWRAERKAVSDTGTCRRLHLAPFISSASKNIC